ncbi:hypothetical protein [Nocardioides salarius]|uniref:hypothetical protein n=1 Tax=Nocardioides salarius TaxID=374513 RepID=UPI0030F76C68
MPAAENRPKGPGARDYSSLPPDQRLDETIATVDADMVPDPQAGQNLDQRRALRDD